MARQRGLSAASLSSLSSEAGSSSNGDVISTLAGQEGHSAPRLYVLPPLSVISNYIARPGPEQKQERFSSFGCQRVPSAQSTPPSNSSSSSSSSSLSSSPSGNGVCNGIAGKESIATTLTAPLPLPAAKPNGVSASSSPCSSSSASPLSCSSLPTASEQQVCSPSSPSLPAAAAATATADTAGASNGAGKANENGVLEYKMDSEYYERGQRWLNLLNPAALRSRFAPGLYEKLLAQKDTLCPFLRNIRKDIARTYPAHPYFSPPYGGKEALFRVLVAYSIYDIDIGYSQGMAFIAGLLLLHVESEEDAFWCLVRVMYSPEYNLRAFYTDDCKTLKGSIRLFEALVNRELPELGQHFAREGISANMYATQWIVTVWTYRIPLSFAVRVWDRFLNVGHKTVYQTGIAVLRHHAAALLEMGFEQAVLFLGQLDEGQLPVRLAEEEECEKVHITRQDEREIDRILRLSG